MHVYRTRDHARGYARMAGRNVIHGATDVMPLPT